MSVEKIGPQHRARKAVLYVRQSSVHQVQHNRESQGLQYAMRDRLLQLGWSQVEVIDEDLGCSAAGGTLRAGFERMVAEVCLGKVGAVAAREVSRFARNSRDWQQLVEMCRVVDTLLIDQEAVYAPRQGNDRLLLGLGREALNEYELDLLRQRLPSRRAMRRRVAASWWWPRPSVSSKWATGWRKIPTGAVQAAIELAIEKVAEPGAAYGRPSSGFSNTSFGPADPGQLWTCGVAAPSPLLDLARVHRQPCLWGRLRLWADRRDRALWRSRSQARGAAQASCRLVGVEAWRPSRLHRLGPGGEAIRTMVSENVPTAFPRGAKHGVRRCWPVCCAVGVVAAKLTVQYTGAKGQDLPSLRLHPRPTRLWRAQLHRLWRPACRRCRRVRAAERSAAGRR